LLKGDRRLTTSSQQPSGLESFFPNQELITLPPGTSARDIAAAHHHRLAELPRGEIDILTADSLFELQRAEARRVVDVGCKNRIYIRLTASEIGRLQRETLSVA
jgi:hypothetical protein